MNSVITVANHGNHKEGVLALTHNTRPVRSLGNLDLWWAPEEKRSFGTKPCKCDIKARYIGGVNIEWNCRRENVKQWSIMEGVLWEPGACWDMPVDSPTQEAEAGVSLESSYSQSALETY